MSFGDQYLEKQILKFNFSFDKPDKSLGLCVIIPCYDEDRLIETLNSLWRCKRPAHLVEVIIVVNSSLFEKKEILARNLATIDEFNDWEKQHRDNQLIFLLAHTPDLPEKHAGPGLARKIGMDLAIARFNQIQKPDGILISLDADCTCSDDYLITIEAAFSNNKNIDCATISFEHPLTGMDYSQAVYNAIIQYELHLRYHIEYLRYIGYPYAFHTLGSCFAVKAASYVKQGGMNQRKAGEDFYFLHKLFANGNTVEINNTTVIPSPRPSSRVVFGTGPVINKLSTGSNSILKTYHPNAYNDLKQLLDLIPSLYEYNDYEAFSDCLPETITGFLMQHNVFEKVNEIKQNTASQSAFVKRFHTWFTPLMVVRFLNYAHQKYYSMVPIGNAAKELLVFYNQKQSENQNLLELLSVYRSLQKDKKPVSPF